ncbi:hypothetical protein MK079_00185 [Candidatus Gracilibacteria bacterium]|nr:hypothetical protein [Candidatus Gracilibacteria bacterium]
MYSSDKNASVLVYVLLLVNIAVITGIAVFNSSFILSNNRLLFGDGETLEQALQQKAEIVFDHTLQYNSNGSGMVDVLSCPENVIFEYDTLNGSGEIIRESSSSLITTLGYMTGSIVCMGDFLGDNFEIFWNQMGNNFSASTYLSTIVTLTGTTSWQTLSNFGDTNNTTLSFDDTGTNGDGIDDNFDDDNYSITSSGSLYPNGYQDDDTLHRKKIVGKLFTGAQEQNIFWENSDITQIIQNNPNNTDPYHELLGDVSDGIMYLSFISSEIPIIDIKILRFDAGIYQQTGELVLNASYEGNSISTPGGYLQRSGNNSVSFSGSRTGQEFVFDFHLYDYALFLSNQGTRDIFYQLSSESGTGTTTGTGIYIVPVHETENEINILSNHIFLDDERNIFFDQKTYSFPQP